MKWTIEYRDFKPNTDLIRALKHDLDQLIEKSPYASFTKMILTQHGNEFHGLLQINSIHKKFISVATSGRISDVANRLLTEIHDQLADWKILRAV